MGTLEEEQKKLRRERRRLKAEYGELYGRALDILFRHDPIGITVKMHEKNYDEYSPEVSSILPRLQEAQSVEDVTRITHEEFVRWFDARIAGAEEDYCAVGQDIWEAWQSHRDRSPHSSRVAG